MTDKFQINLNPTEPELKNIEKWLVDEYNKYDEGFYCNWNIIEKSFSDKELITFKIDDKIIGFVVWSQNENVIDIDIMEIHPDYRKKGYGKKLFEMLECTFREKKNIAIVLFCEPRESEFFWRKMGFIKFPKRGWSESDLTFYKPLIDVLESTQNPNNLNRLELWNVEPYESAKVSPKWSWNIETNQEKLEKPIMQPCNVNWNVRWIKNGKVIKEDKVKYFAKDYCIENGPFMFIEELKE